MKKTISLNSKQLKQLANSIREVSKVFSNNENKIIEALSEYTKEQVEKNISSTRFEDGTHDLEAIIEKKDNSILVGMRGKQSVYDEFGTGTEGESNQHPMKSGKNLNPYNSGSTIRKADSYTSEMTGIPQGELYWTYRGKNGEKIYTTGVPAGKQVYSAYQQMKQKKKSIIKEIGSDMLSKL